MLLKYVFTIVVTLVAFWLGGKLIYVAIQEKDSWK